MEQVGAIATGHEASARAGAEILADGGNAVDAATAAAFAACHCEPTLTGLGGAGFATVHVPGQGEHCIDFFTTVPGIGGSTEIAGQPVPVDVLFGASTQTFHVGPMSVAIPGFVRGVLHMQRRFGTMPIERVLEPAIRIARDGITLPPQQAYCHHLLTPILTRTGEGKRVFAPAGPMLVAGDHFAQPELADTLELLAREGDDAFYRGDLAREIVAWSDAAGGLITRADLEQYVAVERQPVRGSWRGRELVTQPPPSSGGALIAFALAVLERANGGVDGAPIDIATPAGAAALVAAMIASNGIRGREFDSHLYSGGDMVEWLLSAPQYERGAAFFAAGLDVPPGRSSRLGSTTHLSVIDANGAAVSMTTTTGCGSGEFVGTTGIHLNNMMGEEDLLPVEHVLSPGDRLTSMMSPSLIMADGRPVMATGSAGSNRLRGAILQPLLRVLESRGRSDATLQQRLDDAVQAPRLHAEGGYVQVEPGFSAEVVAELERRGHELNHWPGTNMFFGGSNVVAVDEDGSFAAAGDHRRGGGAFLAYRDGSVTPA